ncbi:hypothetical protein [Flagellimonas meridianipacifica]|uniref:Uncharacterized protein n=1 Tax=Flagellimonas meridianipacifica TaxID=1080225 RepID=A0A2T0MAN3_9FLAO|nr:hypothetical protein [Allomuricauda pacifica]PRX54540.1 hypothetical protein CLV81_2941 [Allomuricauda pacifica]
MKKVFGIVAVAVFSLGMFSCESETNVQETEALFETLKVDVNSGEGDGQVDPDRT